MKFHRSNMKTEGLVRKSLKTVKNVFFNDFERSQIFANSTLSFHVRAMKLHKNVPWHCSHEFFEAEFLIFAF